MSDKCLIISGGRFVNLPPHLIKADYIIAADSGFDHADRYGLVPDIVIGDLDSVSDDNRERLMHDEIAFKRYPCRKDDTDTSIAIKYALELGYKDINIVCAFGNRMDHSFSNIQAAHYGAAHGAVVRLFDEATRVVVFSNTVVRIKKTEGCSLSVFSLTDESRGVTISGTEYILTDGVLRNSFPLGQSNEFADEEACISVRDGVLMVISSRIT